jgi:nicotinamidase-related amidase
MFPPAIGYRRRVPAALIITDMLNSYDHEDAEPLKDSVRSMLGNLSGLMEAAREDGLRIIYVNDNHGDFTAGPKDLAQQALDGPNPELVEPVLPPDDVPFIPKARHSIFYSTLLEYFLRREDIDRLVLAGQVTEQCILYSALDGYVRHFQVIIPTDAVAHIDDEMAKAALRMMETNMHAELVEGSEDVLRLCRD